MKVSAASEYSTVLRLRLRSWTCLGVDELFSVEWQGFHGAI